MEEPKLRISKLAAARRQLDCAIEMWFLDKDAVSVHTLAAAAVQIIHDLNEQKGKPGEMLFGSKIIKPEYQKKMAGMMRKPANFFKHADNDPDEIVEFPPFLTLAFLMSSMVGLGHMGETPSHLEQALGLWITLHEPEYVGDEARKRIVNSAGPQEVEKVKRMSKADFLKSYLRQRATAL